MQKPRKNWKRLTNSAILIGIATISSGCATIRYGRMQPVGAAEKASLDCPAIAAESAKCDEFGANINAQFDEHGVKRTMGYLGDFGIGNQMEMNDAIDSVNTRKAQLHELSVEKHCLLASANSK